MAKRGEKNREYLDGRKVFEPKRYTGIKFKGWYIITYQKVTMEQNWSFQIRLANKQEISISKQQARIIKSKNKVYIKPEYYESTIRHLIEKPLEIA